ncbi:hypothetical protein KI387_016155, partial [Taxus chinensis]
MTQRARIAEAEGEEQGGIHDSAKRWRGIPFELQDLKKARRNFKLIVALLLLSYALTSLCITFINPMMAHLYGSREEIFYTNINLQTRITFHNHPLEITQQQQQQKLSASESNPKQHKLNCSSLIK